MNGYASQLVVVVRSAGQDRFSIVQLAQYASTKGQLCHRFAFVSCSHPRDHMSTAGPYRVSPNNNSGARYHRVTTILVYSFARWGGISGSFVHDLARPKSAIMIEPLRPTRIFAVFISRWT
jgi:hypothetical protein